MFSIVVCGAFLHPPPLHFKGDGADLRRAKSFAIIHLQSEDLGILLEVPTWDTSTPFGSNSTRGLLFLATISEVRRRRISWALWSLANLFAPS